MVVRSNGCFACKRRRIKCDQARPRCKRCAIHRIPCPGYPSDSANPINIVVYGSPNSSSHSDDSRHHELIPLHVDSTAQKRMQLIASAAEGFVPYGDTPAVPLDLMDISRFNAISIRQPVLDAAMSTLALAHLGTTWKNPDLLVHAQREYGRSLRLLSSYITRSNSSKVWDPQVASAMVVLKFCEPFEPLHPLHSIEVHHIGLRSFYLNRGPTPVQSHTESILFCQARTIILGGSLAQRRKCFFEEAEWLTVSLTAPGRDPFFELLDIAVHLPGIVETADGSLERGDERSIQNTLVQFECLIHELDDFATRFWPVTSDSSAQAQPQDSREWLSSKAIFDKTYDFSNWRSANVYCTWATARLYTRLESQRLLLHASHNELIPHNRQRQEEVETDVVRNLEDLCRGIPSQLGSRPHTMGIICSMGMLEAASELLENRGRVVEAAWCKSVLDRLRDDGFR